MPTCLEVGLRLIFAIAIGARGLNASVLSCASPRASPKLGPSEGS